MVRDKNVEHNFFREYHITQNANIKKIIDLTVFLLPLSKMNITRFKWSKMADD